jgi:hypothetical protein
VTIADDAIPPVFQPTVYNGILNLDPALSGNTDTPRGQLIINITDSGVFTGTFFSQGKRYPVRGAFEQGGTAVAAVKFSKKKIAILFLAKGEGNSLFVVMFGQEQLSGFLSPIFVPNPAVDLKLTGRSRIDHARPARRSRVRDAAAAFERPRRRSRKVG